jgi:hypothetical protein
VLVPCAFAACAAAAFFLAGCGKGGQDAGADGSAGGRAPDAGEAPVQTVAPRLADAGYREALGRQAAERGALLKARDALASTMRARVNAVRASLSTDDAAAVSAELAKDPEWAGLRARLADLNKALEDTRRHSAALVREKIFSDIKESNLK